MISLHEHNEASRVERVLACLSGGGTVAVVSDAGTPGISDPGALLVSRAIEAGQTISVVPGPTSIVAALVVSGLPCDRFCVEGFLPRKGRDRHERIAAVMADQRTSVILEAPGRLVATLSELSVVDAARRIAVVRELTKVHEEVWRGTVAEAASVFAEHQVRGEVVVVIGGAPPAEPASDDMIDQSVRERLASGPDHGPRQIADAVANELGVPRRKVYEAVLRLRGERGDRSGG